MSKRPSKPPDNDSLWIFIGVIMEIVLFFAFNYALDAFDVSEEARGTISQFVFVALLLLAIIGTIIWAFMRRKREPPASRVRKRRRQGTGGKRKRARE